jgi:hypothetical protein
MFPTLKVAGLAWPQGKAVVVPGREHAKCHFGAYRRIGPLIAVEIGGIELVDGEIGLRPGSGEGEDPEMEEHAEAPINEITLDLLPSPAASAVGAGGVSASATVDWAASLVPAVPPLPPPSVVALPPEPPDAARSTPASATVVVLPEPPEARRATVAAVCRPRLPDQRRPRLPLLGPPVPAELEEGDVVPPDNRVDESVLVAPPPWPPVWTELPPVVPPVDALPPVPELPPGPVAPPADPSWFTLGALLLQARPIAHANRVETSLVFMGVGKSGECDGFEGFFTLKHRNLAKTPSREMSSMWDLLLTIRAGRGRARGLALLSPSRRILRSDLANICPCWRHRNPQTSQRHEHTQPIFNRVPNLPCDRDNRSRRNGPGAAFAGGSRLQLGQFQCRGGCGRRDCGG